MKKVAVRLGMTAFVVALLCLGLLKEAAPVFWEETLPKEYVFNTLYISLAVLGFMVVGALVGFVATSGLAVLSAVVMLAFWSWPVALIVGFVFFIAWDQLRGGNPENTTCSGSQVGSAVNNSSDSDVLMGITKDAPYGFSVGQKHPGMDFD